jgi:catechol 2,3-dioxygenase-like lactoylglutathione lyase family enzyme
MSAYLAAEATVFVTDMDAGLSFYTEALGCRVVTTHGEPAFFALMGAGSARFALRHVDTPAIDPASAMREELIALTLVLPSAGAVDERFAQAVGAGANAHTAPLDRPWGSRNAILRDPSGNLVLLAA